MYKEEGKKNKQLRKTVESLLWLAVDQRERVDSTGQLLRPGRSERIRTGSPRGEPLPFSNLTVPCAVISRSARRSHNALSNLLGVTRVPVLCSPNVSTALAFTQTGPCQFE